MTRDARLPHSCEFFDIGGAFATSSFGSQMTRMGGFWCPCRFLDAGHGFNTSHIGSGLVVSSQSSWCQQLEASGFAMSLELS